MTIIRRLRIEGNKLMYKNKQIGISSGCTVGCYKPLGNRFLKMLGIKEEFIIEYEGKIDKEAIL